MKILNKCSKREANLTALWWTLGVVGASLAMGTLTLYGMDKLRPLEKDIELPSSIFKEALYLGEERVNFKNRAAITDCYGYVFEKHDMEVLVISSARLPDGAPSSPILLKKFQLHGNTAYAPPELLSEGDGAIDAHITKLENSVTSIYSKDKLDYVYVVEI